jgi:perosamine synthetase
MHEGKYCQQAIDNAVLALKSDKNPNDEKGWVESFEFEFAKFVDTKYAIAVNSGTSGLHAALMAAGIQSGDEVISPALTVIMDTLATLYVGAIPVWADVDPISWNLDPRDVQSKISDKTKAIISVSWFGLPSNIQALREIADKHNLILIDDSAETIFNKGLGPANANQPDIRIFSFESKKHMSTGGEGGMVTTNSEALAEKIRKSAGLGYKHLTANAGRTSLAARVFQNPGYSRFDKIGFNYRMTPVTAAIGLGQLTNLPHLLDSRISVAKSFAEAVGENEWLKLQNLKFSPIHSYYTFGLEFQAHLVNFGWQDFYDKFIELGGDGFYSNCLNPYLEPVLIGQTFGVVEAKYGLNPIAEKLQKNIMAFKTNYLDLNKIEKQAETLSNTIKHFEQRYES